MFITPFPGGGGGGGVCGFTEWMAPPSLLAELDLKRMDGQRVTFRLVEAPIAPPLAPTLLRNFNDFVTLLMSTTCPHRAPPLSAAQLSLNIKFWMFLKNIGDLEYTAPPLGDRILFELLRPSNAEQLEQEKVLTPVMV
ncbi:Uncharacterised protein [Chlamydia abortus]|nr:Uncharacterised protein [Chlamydia abortus]